MDGRTGQFDWDAVAESREFQDLLRSRRRFLVLAVALFSGIFLAFLGLLAWAPDSMAEHAVGSVSWALVWGASLIFMAFVMAWLYSRKSAEWAELSERLVERANGTRTVAEGGAR